MSPRLGAFILLCLLALPIGTEAGIFSFSLGHWGRGEGMVLGARTAQTMSLLDASSPTASSPTAETQIVDGNSFLSAAGPMGTAADFASATPATSDQISIYTVRAGDSLSVIADMFNVSVNTILWANDLKKGAAIHEGDKLVILPITGVQYTVKKGDTLASVAKKFGGDPDDIVAFNNLSDGKLAAGEMIIIPDGEVAPSGVKKPPLPAYSNYYAWPVGGGRKTQGYHGHNGIDIGAPNGTPVYAAAGGTVLIAKDGGWNGAYGSYIVIKHNNGTQTLYAHLSAVNVRPGQIVDQKQLIGRVGSTGRSTGPHLHFEVRGARNPF